MIEQRKLCGARVHLRERQHHIMQRRHPRYCCAQRLEVPLRIRQQVCRRGDPQRALVPVQPRVEDDRRLRAPLTHSRPVGEQEAVPRAARARRLRVTLPDQQHRLCTSRALGVGECVPVYGSAARMQNGHVR